MKPSELIRQKGWCQHSYAQSVHEPTRAHCDVWPRISPFVSRYSAAGAIRACKADGLSVKLMAKSILKSKGQDRLIQGPSDAWKIIQAWNNEEGRTAAEVIAKLEEFGL